MNYIYYYIVIIHLIYYFLIKNEENCSLTSVISLSAPVRSSSRKRMSGLWLTTRLPKPRLLRLMAVSVNPEAPNVVSYTFGTCSLKINGRNFRIDLRRVPPRPGPQAWLIPQSSRTRVLTLVTAPLLITIQLTYNTFCANS